MLYDTWRQVARERAREVALIDAADGRRWTFAELSLLAESKIIASGPIVFPQGKGIDFILSVLAGWREARVVSPLDLGQVAIETGELPKEIVHLKTTSATTGSARLVAFTSSQIRADVDNIVATMGLKPEWPNIGVISWAHSYGFSNLVLPLLLYGIPLVWIDTPLPESLKTAASAFPELTLPAVPALWRFWCDSGAIPSNVRLAISAGAPLPLALEEEIFRRFGLKIHNFYGSTECGGIAYDRTSIPRTDASLAGQPMENVAVSAGMEGCLLVSGQAVGETYWPTPSDALKDGKFQTRDLVEIRDGGVFLCGRANDQINVAGRKLSPEAVEKALLEHPAVKVCVVFGIPSEADGRAESIVAAIVPHTEISVEILRRFLLTKLPPWQVPREWWMRERLDVNERGKLSRAELRRAYLDWRKNARRAGG